MDRWGSCLLSFWLKNGSLHQNKKNRRFEEGNYVPKPSIGKGFSVGEAAAKWQAPPAAKPKSPSGCPRAGV
jgi:hypothetical protein